MAAVAAAVAMAVRSNLALCHLFSPLQTLLLFLLLLSLLLWAKQLCYSCHPHQRLPCHQLFQQHRHCHLHHYRHRYRHRHLHRHLHHRPHHRPQRPLENPCFPLPRFPLRPLTRFHSNRRCRSSLTPARSKSSRSLGYRLSLPLPRPLRRSPSCTARWNRHCKISCPKMTGPTPLPVCLTFCTTAVHEAPTASTWRRHRCTCGTAP
mmetsp:Transcript_6352/g.12038  ORF Transcript_6352/g.12038 Transcript_6352/m.12038 type:complete len:206 (-) Transcript_6352:172-789(-)